MQNDRVKREKILFILGCAFLTTGIFTVTIIPLLLRRLDIIILPTGSTFSTIAFMFYFLGALFYAFSFDYYKNQLNWIAKLVVFYILFQLILKAYLNFGFVNFTTL